MLERHPMSDYYFTLTLPKMWKWWLQGIWRQATDKPIWKDVEVSRCHLCKRRLSYDQMVSFAVHKTLDERPIFITTCLNHGDYEGQKVIDCFTGVEVVLSKEPAFYRQFLLANETTFYVKAISKSIVRFFTELPYTVLCSVDLVLRKMIEREKERLGIQ